MNLKRIFGATLTILGIIGIIYGAIAFIQNQAQWLTSIIAFGVGVIFFISGINLVKTTKDAA